MALVTLRVDGKACGQRPEPRAAIDAQARGDAFDDVRLRRPIRREHVGVAGGRERQRRQERHRLLRLSRGCECQQGYDTKKAEATAARVRGGDCHEASGAVCGVSDVITAMTCSRYGRGYRAAIREIPHSAQENPMVRLGKRGVVRDEIARRVSE